MIKLSPRNRGAVETKYRQFMCSYKKTILYYKIRLIKIILFVILFLIKVISLKIFDYSNTLIIPIKIE